MSFMDDYWAKNKIVGHYGVPYLDKELLGISCSDLVVIGARSGAGKSTLGRIIYENNDRLTTALFSLENFEGDVEAEDIRKKYNEIMHTRISTREWQTGQITPDRSVFEQIENGINEEMRNSTVFGRKTPDGNPWTVETLRQEMMRCVTSEGINLIILDHLDYLDRDNPNESDISHVTELMKMIRDVQEVAPQGCGVVAFSHLRKPLGKVEDIAVPNENEFIGSSNKIKQATHVIMLAPDNKPNEGKGFGTWCCIRKNRSGGIKNEAALLYFDPTTASYNKNYDLYTINYSGTKTTPVSNFSPVNTIEDEL